MKLQDRIVVVTGAASGIGAALARQFHAAGARHVVCADLDAAGAISVAAEIGGTGLGVDVSREEEIAALVARVEREVGPVDLFCSNAGISIRGGVEVSNAHWQKMWEVNVMAHVWAARHMLPHMIARGGGYFLHTSSAAGLLSHVGSAPYAVTKHAAVSFAEWLALAHGDDGIRVSVLCPQAVNTAMLKGKEQGVASVNGLIEPKEVAEQSLMAIEAERFLVLPHPEVLDYMRRKTADYDRWIGGMRKLRRQFSDAQVGQG